MSDELISHDMYECFMNTRYLCTCLKKISCKFEPQARLQRVRNIYGLWRVNQPAGTVGSSTGASFGQFERRD